MKYVVAICSNFVISCQTLNDAEWGKLHQGVCYPCLNHNPRVGGSSPLPATKILLISIAYFLQFLPTLHLVMAKKCTRLFLNCFEPKMLHESCTKLTCAASNLASNLRFDSALHTVFGFILF